MRADKEVESGDGVKTACMKRVGSAKKEEKWGGGTLSKIKR